MFGSMGSGMPQRAPMMGGQGPQGSQGQGFGQRFQQQMGQPPGHMMDQFRQWMASQGQGGPSPQGEGTRPISPEWLQKYRGIPASGQATPPAGTPPTGTPGQGPPRTMQDVMAMLQGNQGFMDSVPGKMLMPFLGMLGGGMGGQQGGAPQTPGGQPPGGAPPPQQAGWQPPGLMNRQMPPGFLQSRMGGQMGNGGGFGQLG
jgi:hypothetical protein